MKYLFLLFAVPLLMACNGAVKMGYDETNNPPIVETNLNLTPKENVRQFLADQGVAAQSVAIYSSPRKDCACARLGDDCYCRLDNQIAYGMMCADAETLCKKEKYIEVEVSANDVEMLAALGFESTE